MQLTLLKGYPDFVGKRALFVGYGNGPASFDATNGDVVTIPLSGWYIDAINGGAASVSGTYFVCARPVATGPRQSWALFWYLSSTGAVVSAATNLSAEKVQFGGFCGQY